MSSKVDLVFDNLSTTSGNRSWKTRQNLSNMRTLRSQNPPCGAAVLSGNLKKMAELLWNSGWNMCTTNSLSSVLLKCSNTITARSHSSTSMANFKISTKTNKAANLSSLSRASQSIPSTLVLPSGKMAL